MSDYISRKMVLALPRNKVRSLSTYEVIEETINVTDIEQLPSAQPEHGWIPVSKRLPDKYGEYRITWTTSFWKKSFVGDSVYEVTGEWDDKCGNFKGEWLFDDYIKAYPDVKVIAWKPIEEPYTEREEK